MPAALMLSDVVVHASTEAEAFGRVVIEAQAMGRPVIATDLGGPRETVRHGETGWLTNPGDVDALARALEEALSMDAEARVGAGRSVRAPRCCAATRCGRCGRRRWTCTRRCWAGRSARSAAERRSGRGR